MVFVNDADCFIQPYSIQMVLTVLGIVGNAKFKKKKKLESYLTIE